MRLPPLAVGIFRSLFNLLTRPVVIVELVDALESSDIEHLLSIEGHHHPKFVLDVGVDRRRWRRCRLSWGRLRGLGGRRRCKIDLFYGAIRLRRQGLNWRLRGKDLQGFRRRGRTGGVDFTDATFLGTFGGHDVVIHAESRKTRKFTIYLGGVRQATPR